MIRKQTLYATLEAMVVFVEAETMQPDRDALALRYHYDAASLALHISAPLLAVCIPNNTSLAQDPTAYGFWWH